MDRFSNSIKTKYRERRLHFESQWPPCHSNLLVTLDVVERKKGQSSDKEAKQLPLAYEDLFKSGNLIRPVRKILIEGNAGTGKTTLCISASEDWANGKLFQQFELLLLLPLRQKQVSSATSMADLLKLLHTSPSIRDSVAHYLEEEEGEKVLIIADGWDELSEADRSDDSFLYKLLFEILPLVSVVLTSRPSASAPLHRLPCFDRFIEVKGFNRASVEKYIQSEFDNDKQKGDRLLERLENDPLAASLCSTPINCAIVCHLWRTLEEALPTTMAQLYTQVILNIIVHNVHKVHKSVLSLSNFDSLPIELQESWWFLCEFAFRALEKDQTVFTREELDKFFPESLTSSILTSFSLLRSTETIFETGSGVSFQFLHLTFQEYLAALYLLKQPQHTLQIFMQSNILESSLIPFSSKNFLPVKPIFSTKSKKFSMVWQLFFGIYFCKASTCHLTIDDITELLSHLWHDSLYHLQLLCRCAFEAKNSVISKKIIQLLGFPRLSSTEGYILNGVKVVNFGHAFTRYDCAAVIYLISQMEGCGAIMINFSNSNVGEKQIHSLTDALASKHGRLQVVMLNLSGNKLTDKSIRDLLHRASGAFKLGGTIDLSSNTIGVESVESLSIVLKARAHLSLTSGVFDNSQNDSNLLALEKAIKMFPFPLTLNLSHNPLEISGLLALEDAIRSYGGLHIYLNLYLIGSLTSDADVNSAWLISFLEACSLMLFLLDISENNLGAPGALVLGRMLNECGLGLQDPLNMPKKQLFSGQMNLSKTNLGDEGLSAFVECMDSPCNLNKLWLNSNTIHAIGFSCLTDAICLGKIENLNELHLMDNPLGFVGAMAASRMLSNSRCQLTTLILVACQLTSGVDDHAIVPNVDPMSLANGTFINQICKMTSNYTITELALNYNCFAGGHIHILAGFMYLCANLESLGTIDCKIASGDLRQLLDLLTELKSSSPHLCNKLKEWYLNDNELDAAGVSALISCGPSLLPSLDCAKDLYLDNNPIKYEGLRVRHPLPPENVPQVDKDGRSIKFTFEGGYIRYPLSFSSKGLQTQEKFKSATEIVKDGVKEDNIRPKSLTVNDPKPLTVDDLAIVQHKVWDGRTKWYNIGLALKLTPGTLDAILKTNHRVVDDCLTDMLKEWLYLQPSWSDLATALRDKTVGLENLAEQLPRSESDIPAAESND